MLRHRDLKSVKNAIRIKYFWRKLGCKLGEKRFPKFHILLTAIDDAKVTGSSGHRIIV